MDFFLLGIAMTLMLAGLYTYNVKVIGSCFAHGDVKSGLIALIAVVMIIALAFFGQKEVSIIKAQDPFAEIITGSVNLENHKDSMMHIIGTGILAALTLISITISYLYHKEKRRVQSIEGNLEATVQQQSLDHELHTKQLAIARLERKPDEEAQNRVNDQLHQLEKEIADKKRMINECLDQIAWIRAKVKIARDRFELAITNEYQKSK